MLAGPILNTNMFGKRFEKELEMISKALVNEQEERKFRKYVKPYLESVVDLYITEKKLENENREELIKAGWSHFNIALKKYKGRAELMIKRKNDLFYFNTYLNWYIRQGILEYIQSKRK